MYFDVKKMMILTCDKCKDDNVAFKLSGNSYAVALSSQYTVKFLNCEDCRRTFKEENVIMNGSGLCPYERRTKDTT